MTDTGHSAAIERQSWVTQDKPAGAAIGVIAGALRLQWQAFRTGR